VVTDTEFQELQTHVQEVAKALAVALKEVEAYMTGQKVSVEKLHNATGVAERTAGKLDLRAQRRKLEHVDTACRAYQAAAEA
jgi:uncharacterized protein Yka (UPF0111/DUF47 family)